MAVQAKYLLCFLTVLATLDKTNGVKPQNVDKSRWMSELREFIGDKRLGDIVIPGSHDAATSGIDENSHLIDRNFLYQLAHSVVPEVLVNWSKTHDDELGAQLKAGFRWFDLRIADVELYEDTFRWWHGLSGHEIFAGLQQVYDFAVLNKEEVIWVEFNHFAAAGNFGTKPIPDHRKDLIADIFLQYLEPVLVPKSNLSNNPTINDILATGRNVIAEVRDNYIADKSDLFWPGLVHSSWSGRTNPEELFEERSGKMADFLINHRDEMTLISGCATPDEKTIAGAMIRVYGDDPIIKPILEILLPGVANLDDDFMSFEGVFVDLVNQAKLGTNTQGMFARPAVNYTNGASVQYMGMNSQWLYWLARPDVYKFNIMSVDDFVSSTAVDVAILANMGEIPRQTSVSFQGNTRDGFYEWVDYQAIGGADGNFCGDILVRYSVNLENQVLLQQRVHAADKWTVSFAEDDYPSQAIVVVDVETPSGEMLSLYEGNIREMIDGNLDIYVRGSDQGGNHGFAYVSEEYNLFGDDCVTPPAAGYLKIVVW